MDWKLLLIFIFITCDEIYARPGIRSPPTELQEKFLQETEITATTNDTKMAPILTDGREFPSASVQSQNQLKAFNKTTTVSPKNSHYESEMNYHAGIAVPLTQEDIERELNEAAAPSSTPREGLSTWILLSGTATTPQPPRRITTTKARSPAKKDDKIAKIESTNQKPSSPSLERITLKPKVKPTPTKAAKKQNEVQRVEPNLIRRKKPTLNAENRPVQIKKKTTTTTTTTTVSPATTIAPTSTEPAATTTTPETTTFLILEPKDADFDMPQDRSPGPTTKKPRRNNTNKKKKKNGLKSKTEVAEKKPLKNQNSKDKPLTTKIYNYLAREVMPTVGVGLVGLAVTAGIATYFLGTPFGALRRSYEVADRKDDMYFYNNEEYAGTDGQSEEEVFGKVIAGMPVNSPYRNSIKYSNYNRPQQQQPQQQTQHQVRYDPKFARHPQQQQQQQQIHYRNNDPSYYNQQPGGYSKSRPQEPNTQQYFRYNNDGNVYRTNDQHSDLQNTYSNSYLAEENDELPNSSDPGVKIKIVTPPVTTETEPITDSPMLDNDVLRRRSQFVVGSIQAVSTEDPGHDDGIGVIDAVPEHGPRRRRSPPSTILKRADDNQNEIDGAIPNDDITSTITPLEAIEDVTLSKDEEIVNVENIILPTNQPTQPPRETIFDLIRSILEIKVRMGLSFLRNTTDAVGKYLQKVEKRIDESKVFPKTNHRTN